MSGRVIIHLPASRITDVLEALQTIGLTALDVLCDEPERCEDGGSSQVVVTAFAPKERLEGVQRALADMSGSIDITIFESAFAN